MFTTAVQEAGSEERTRSKDSGWIGPRAQHALHPPCAPRHIRETAGRRRAPATPHQRFNYGQCALPLPSWRTRPGLMHRSRHRAGSPASSEVPGTLSASSIRCSYRVVPQCGFTPLALSAWYTSSRSFDIALMQSIAQTRSVLGLDTRGSGASVRGWWLQLEHPYAASAQAPEPRRCLACLARSPCAPATKKPACSRAMPTPRRGLSAPSPLPHRAASQPGICCTIQPHAPCTPGSSTLA